MEHFGDRPLFMHRSFRETSKWLLITGGGGRKSAPRVKEVSWDALASVGACLAAEARLSLSGCPLDTLDRQAY